MYRGFIKRFLDIIFAIISLPFVLIIICVCAILIKTEDSGSVFYLAKRLGKNKKTFKMYKLRTMKENAPDIRNKDGSTYNSDSDPRLTKVGKLLRKTSIDELPQILNVLKGDMSFIGPRPDLPEHIHQYSATDIEKLDVAPGISGYNQAFFRNSAQWKERLENDVYYVQNVSLFLDMRIFVKTIGTILLKRGVYVVSQNKDLKESEKN